LIRHIEKLRHDHAVGAFDCGHHALNRFLHQYALVNQVSGSSTTYVGVSDQTVIGYYSLAVGSVEYEEAPARITQGLAHHPVPIALLAKLAVDQQWQNRGVGKGLLRDAMLRTLHAADILGIRAMMVHAKDEGVKGFSQHFNFSPSPSDPLQLMMILNDVRQIVQETAH